MRRGEYEREPVQDALDRVVREVGSPLPVVFETVEGGDVGRQPPEHVGPGKAAGGAVDVLPVVGAGVVPSVVGNPADRAALRPTAADGHEEIFARSKPPTDQDGRGSTCWLLLGLALVRHDRLRGADD